ncbi:hypothetical protein [Cohnella luojiensis]|uniref:Discoidin domain-containing protein n=1 Tax=Cohnella luojiensis TaxID=652876 RepID=A0A4Y8LNV3_9BACL|nr:hypothetical protein [Cohnella luojiensis]TFE22685.1 hypothetical protein E2980_21280 [Cohnella luojiensis]
MYVSKDGEHWGEPSCCGEGASPSIATSLTEQTARFVKVVLTEANDSWWSISEVKIAKFGKVTEALPVETGSLDRSAWVVTGESAQAILDGNPDTRWSTGNGGSMTL